MAEFLTKQTEYCGQYYGKRGFWKTYGYCSSENSSPFSQFLDGCYCTIWQKMLIFKNDSKHKKLWSKNTRIPLSYLTPSLQNHQTFGVPLKVNLMVLYQRRKMKKGGRGRQKKRKKTRDGRSRMEPWSDGTTVGRTLSLAHIRRDILKDHHDWSTRHHHHCHHHHYHRHHTELSTCRHDHHHHHHSHDQDHHYPPTPTSQRSITTAWHSVSMPLRQRSMARLWNISDFLVFRFDYAAQQEVVSVRPTISNDDIVASDVTPRYLLDVAVFVHLSIRSSFCPSSTD